MALQILIPTRGNLFAPAAPQPAPSRGRQARRTNRRRHARTAAAQGQRLRVLLVRHWSPVAANTRPAPLPPPVARERTNVSSCGLLKQCEGLLRILCRHRLRALGLRQPNVAGVARRFDMDHYGAVGTPDALAYVMALMHWRGCSIPASCCGGRYIRPQGSCAGSRRSASSIKSTTGNCCWSNSYLRRPESSSTPWRSYGRCSA